MFTVQLYCIAIIILLIWHANIPGSIIVELMYSISSIEVKLPMIVFVQLSTGGVVKDGTVLSQFFS
jgi:hypothetical protein